jgi:hypothetical protein
MGLLDDYFAILAVLLLVEAEAYWKIELRLRHHSLHSHHLRLHVLVLSRKILRHTARHHHSWILTGSSCHHHILAWTAHSERYSSSHHHLIVRIPHCSGHLRLLLMNNVNRHSK